MKRYLRLLGNYIHRSFLQWMANRGFLFTLVVDQAAPPLIALAVWTTALPGRVDLGPYYVALLLVRLMTVSYENHTFSNAIYAGTLADDLLRPHPVVFIPLGQNLAIRAWHVILAVPLLFTVAFFVPLHLTGPDLLTALPALLLAAALRFLWTYLLALSAFWTERAHAVVGLGDTLIFLLGGEAAPIALLPPALRAWGEALPFRAMHAFPAELAVGSLAPAQMLAGFGWQLVWLVVFAGLIALTWRAGIRRFTAVGG